MYSADPIVDLFEISQAKHEPRQAWIEVAV